MSSRDHQTHTRFEDNDQLVRTHLEHSTATAELASLIEDADTIEPAHDEGVGELLSEADNAPLDWAVIAPAFVLIAAVVAWGLANQSGFDSFSTSAFNWVITNLGWAFTLFSTIFVAFVLVIALSKFGTIKLGADDEQPEFSTLSWVAMMFAAGMGIGLMFFGASEPLSFYLKGVPGHGEHSVEASMASAMFHWTLHPWALYAIVGLAIAYSTYRMGRKQLISSAFIPLIGERRAEGFWGKLIDVLAIVATVFGTACSLGLGALQIRAGLEASGFVKNPGMSVIVGIVLVLTLCYVLSALSGVGKGIQYLSNANLVLAAILAIFVFIAGPTVYQLNLIPTSIGSYLAQFFEMAARTADSYDGSAAKWLSSWTIFYWAWWVSWSPFVGMFIARISRGRSIREFCLGVLLIPTGVSTIWFAVFGGTAIHFENIGKSIAGDSNEQQLFNLLHQLPGGQLMGVVALLLLATFFVTSADSASTVMGSMSQNGLSEANRTVTASWGIMAALVGLTLLLVGGDDALNSLQSVTIVAATPFLLVVFLLMFSIWKDLSGDRMYLDAKEQQRFSRKLAVERRKHREALYGEAQKERRRKAAARQGK